MERYNLIENDSGLSILRADIYKGKVMKDSGWIHQNNGDFYTLFSARELPDKVFDVLSRISPTVMVEDSEFDPNSCDTSKDHVIRKREDLSVRVYSPALHGLEPSEGLVSGYDVLGLFFVACLQTWHSSYKGTAQESLEVLADTGEKIVRGALQEAFKRGLATPVELEEGMKKFSELADRLRKKGILKD